MREEKQQWTAAEIAAGYRQMAAINLALCEEFAAWEQEALEMAEIRELYQA